jgi:hypothetical protein
VFPVRWYLGVLKKGATIEAVCVYVVCVVSDWVERWRARRLGGGHRRGMDVVWGGMDVVRGGGGDPQLNSKNTVQPLHCVSFGETSNVAHGTRENPRGR